MMLPRIGWIKTVLALGAIATRHDVSAFAFFSCPSSPQLTTSSSTAGAGLWNSNKFILSSCPRQQRHFYNKHVFLATKRELESATSKAKKKSSQKTKGSTEDQNSGTQSSLPRIATSSNSNGNSNGTATIASSSSSGGVQSLLKDPIQLDFVLNDLDLTALSSKVSYFYLHHELGLSEDIMWKITHDAASVLGMTANNIRQKVQVLQFAMDLSIDDIKSIIERQPSLLQLSAMNNLSPTLDWFLDSLQLSKTELRQVVVSQPRLLTCAQSNLEDKLEFFTTTRGLGFSIDECRKLILGEPRLWTCGLKGGLLPRVRFLLHEIGVPKDKLRVAIQKNPRILLYSLQNNLVPKLVNFGIMTLHMEPSKDVTKLLTTYPQILDYNLDRHILPITYYFLNDLDYSVHEFRVILLKFPRLMTNSLRKMKHVVGYLRYELGLDAAGVKRVLYQAPQVLGLDMEGNIAPKVEYLQRILVGADGNGEDDDEEVQRQEVRRLIVGMPTLLNLSVETNLRPKLEYLKKMLETESGSTAAEGDSQENILRETLLRAPPLLGYSLDKRIRPRMEQIVDAGLSASSITIGITMTEAKFQNWLHGHVKKKSKRAIILSGNRGLITAEAMSTGKAKEEKGSTGATVDRSARIVHWKRERKPQSDSIERAQPDELV